MDDLLTRLLVVVAVGGAALLLARGARRFQQPVHPTVDLAGSGLPTGVVLFTSTDCTNCAAARAALQRAGVEYREVTWELEGGTLESAGVEGVPLAVFRASGGATVAQIAGVPRRRPLRRALAALDRAG